MFNIECNTDNSLIILLLMLFSIIFTVTQYLCYLSVTIYFWRLILNAVQ
jgi:hypothetical protein